jgi:hypothetical protein
MKDGYKITKPMVLEDLFMLMAMFTMDIGTMIKLMELESTAISMELNMRETGKKINSTGKVLRHGQMVLGTMGNTFLVKSMESENSLGLMEAHIMEILRKTIFKETANTIGQMEEYLKDPGSTIKWKDKVCSHGLMVEDMRVIIKMIRKKVTVLFIGLMVGNTMEDGKMENNTVWELIPLPVVNQSKENGKKEKDFTGFLQTAHNNDLSMHLNTNLK